MQIDTSQHTVYDLAMKYQPGDRAFIIENGMRIREVTVIRSAAGFCTIRFENGGGTKLRESRLYPAMADAEAEIERNRKSASHGEVSMDWLG